jgi:hypothetical protein
MMAPPVSPDFTGLGHQAPKAAQLLDLLFGTTRAGVEHHEHGVEALFVLPIRASGASVIRLSAYVHLSMIWL